MFNNTSPELKLTKFSLPSNSFYGNGSANNSTLNSSEMPTTSTSDWKTSRTSRTTFTQSTSRTIVKETFLKRFGAVPLKKRTSTDSKQSLQSLPVARKNMDVSRNRSNRSASPDWATCRFSLPPENKKEEHLKEERQKEEHQKEEHQKEDHQKIDQKEDLRKEKVHQKKESHQRNERKRRTSTKETEESKKENRSDSPDWNTSRFSLAPVTPKSASTPRSPPKKKNTSPLMNETSTSRNNRSRSASPDWNTSRFSLPKISIESLKAIHKKISSVSPRILAPLAHRYKTKMNKNAMYKISQNTLDKLLPKPEIHLFDVVKYGPKPQHKDDFLFGLNLMRSEVLTKIDLLHYKKKLRNTGTNFIRTFQEPRKPRSSAKKIESDDSKITEKVEDQPLVPIEIPDQPDEIVIEDEETVVEDDETVNVDTAKELDATDEIDKPEEVIQIEDDDEDKEVDTESEKLLEEAIQDFADKFGSEIVDETTETSNVVDSNIDDSISSVNGNENNSAKESVKISETNTFYHSVTKKHNRNSVDSATKLSNNLKRMSLPNIKNLKKNGVPKKKPSPNKKKNIIKVKWPIARKSLLDLRNNS